MNYVQKTRPVMGLYCVAVQKFQPVNDFPSRKGQLFIHRSGVLYTGQREDHSQVGKTVQRGIRKPFTGRGFVHWAARGSFTGRIICTAAEKNVRVVKCVCKE